MRIFTFILPIVVVSVLSSCSNISTSPKPTFTSTQAAKINAPAEAGAPEGKLEILERRIAARVELYRKNAGLKPMNYHSRMATLARKHSDKLKNKFIKRGKRELNHDGFGSRANKIVLDYSMSRAAENVALIYGQNGDVAATFSRNWMNSPKHKKNILKKWNYTGIGVSIAPDGTIYATQLFGLKTDFTF